MPAVVLAVLIPVVVAQRSGELEPLMFEVSLLGYVVGRWAASRAEAVALGLLTLTAPVAASLIQNPSELAVGIWLLGIAFPWVIGRFAARQRLLTARLQATERELAEQALLGERRRIARDVHDFVGHGLVAVMLQITSARHVLAVTRGPRTRRCDRPRTWSAQRAGLRRMVALLRSDDEAVAASPLPSAEEISHWSRMRARRPRSPAVGPGGSVPGHARRRVALYGRPGGAGDAAEHDACADRSQGRGRRRAGEPDRRNDGPTVPTRQARRTDLGTPTGMRERATALGGEFAAGPTATGWRVSRQLPLEADGEARAGPLHTA